MTGLLELNSSKMNMILMYDDFFIRAKIMRLFCKETKFSLYNQCGCAMDDAESEDELPRNKLNQIT